MAGRGRKSKAELAVTTPANDRRPAPPRELTKAEADQWRAIVSRMPSSWFSVENLPLLSDYCRRICRARVIAEQIDACELDNLKRYAALQKMAHLETNAMIALARSLRLTLQSRVRSDAAGARVASTPTGPRPWEQ
jgi:hypothetical protein